MKTAPESAGDKIDALAETAKHKAGEVIDDAREVATVVAEKVRKHVHTAGEKVADAGERIMKIVKMRQHGRLAMLAVAALLIAPTMARAQGIGIKGGLSYGNVSNSGVLPGENKQRTGFALGLGISSGGVLGFGLEGLYAQRGVSNSTAGDGRELNYIDVPVYLRLAIPNPALTPFAYAGPQASYEISCSDGSGNDCPDTGRPKWTYSAVIGAGVRFGMLAGLSLEGRYIYGLTDLKLSTVSTTESYQTRSFLILLGFSF